MDRHFVSFPKSGRSWLRYALTRLGLGDAIAFHHDGFEYNDAARPPLDFDYAARLKRYGSSRKVVYLHRDPRDVMVSLFHQITGRFSDIFGYTGTMSEFIRDPYFGADNLRRFQDQWTALCRDGHALAISYEACHADFPHVLATVTSYYGFEVDDTALAAAAQDAAFETMRAVEQGSQFDHAWLRLRNGAPKVRRGRIGGFREELGASDIDYLDRMFSAEGAYGNQGSE